MTANNTRNNSVAYLILLLSAPRYGAVNAFKNPAPEASLVQKHTRILFGSAYFLDHFGVVCPEDAASNWSALTANPNPFNTTARKGVKRAVLLSDANRAIIAEGLEWFYENAPTTAKEDALARWVPSQLQQPARAAFANAWSSLMTKMHGVVVKHVDAYLTTNNLHPDQIAQESDGGYNDGPSMLSDPILRPTILAAFVQGIFGPELMVQRAGMQTLQHWSVLGINNVFNLHVHRWQRRLEKFKTNHTKAIDAANVAWSGMFNI